MEPLEGKVVVVTGASEGIGAALTTALRARGAKLVLTARNETRLRALADPADLVVPGDLTLSATGEAIVEQTKARFGRIDVLINNAGRGSYFRASESPLDDARAMFELNFFAPLYLTQLATPLLRSSRGTIVNVSSIGGLITLPWLPIYSASKFALASLTSSQRMELARDGVNVMAVFPGYVTTDFQAHAAGAQPPDPVSKGKRFAISASQCASAIVRGIEGRKKIVITPQSGWLLVWLNHVVPGVVERRMGTV